MKKLFVATIAIFSFSLAQAQQNPSIVREYKKEFKTYGFSDPDPIARMGNIYPYYRFDGYTDKPTVKEWKVVELENDFIKVMILPEIGGKIWGAWEKSTGKPFLYYNQVVKFRDVAMRGPWTSGGIEANYGIIGHTPNCATPMDYLIDKKDDGSVSCYIGTLDLLTQTYWTIEINLPKDKAYFTTRSFWNNSTPLEQPYYTWMNTGIKAAGNLEFIYPGNRYIGHGGEYADWKINRENGKDISFYEQNNFGGYKSYHVFGKYTEFFGAFWHSENFGMGRYSTHDEKPGKKIWIWGLSQQGMIWDKLLTDTDGQYVEVQSGRLFNQAAEQSTFTPFKNIGFAPTSTDEWIEYWFPVKDTDGFVKANSFGALNLRSDKGFLKIDFSPLQNLEEELTVLDGNSIIYSKKVNLKTLTVFSDSIKFNGKTDNISVTLGATKLIYKSNPAVDVLNRPVESPKDFDWNSSYGLYLQGKEKMRLRQYGLAEEKLNACLAKEPNYTPALTEMSALMYRNMEYQKALGYARHAISIDTYDPAGNYYYGLANNQLGLTTDAKDGFDIASLTGEFRGASYLELGKIYLKQNDFEKSLNYINKCLSVNTSNVGAYQLMAVNYRLTNQTDKASETLRKLNSLNPLNHFIRFEEYLLQKSDNNKNNFTSLIRNEMPHETFLQLADWYFSLGLWKESMDILSLSPQTPEVNYWMAFLKNKLKEDNALEFINKGNSLSPEIVFPFRSNSAEVLEWIISQTENWKPKYYLGLIYWNRNNQSRAKELFEKCGTPDFAPFYASKAALTNDENHSGYLDKAAQLDPSQWRYCKLMVNHFTENKNYTQAVSTAKQYHQRFPQDFRINMMLAKSLLLTGEYKACTDLLTKTTILPYEGATDGRQLYRQAWLMQAAQQIVSKKYSIALTSIKTSRLWPANLGVGKPYNEDIDSRLENYMEGLCYQRMKKIDQATEKWNETISFKANTNSTNTLVTALSLKNVGRYDEGEKLLSDWLSKEPDNKIAQWCTAVYTGNQRSIELDGDDNYQIIKLILN